LNHKHQGLCKPLNLEPFHRYIRAQQERLSFHPWLHKLEVLQQQVHRLQSQVLWSNHKHQGLYKPLNLEPFHRYNRAQQELPSFHRWLHKLEGLRRRFRKLM
jgi:hypothetical protein